MTLGHLDGTFGIEYKLVGPIDALKCLVQGLYKLPNLFN